MFSSVLAALALPTLMECQAAATNPEFVYAQSVGLQAYSYGFPIVDLHKQKFNETHWAREDQPVASAVNEIAVYPHLLTPATQGQLRAPNVDTLYMNAWVDLSMGPVLVEVPEMGDRYYTLAFMDLYGKPVHIGTRTNQGRAHKYALVGPSGGATPEGYTVVTLKTDINWMLGRVLAMSAADEVVAKQLAQQIRMVGNTGPAPVAAEPANPHASLQFFDVLNQALKTLPPVDGEAALLAGFNQLGIGPGGDFDITALSESEKLGLGCALVLGPQVLNKNGFKPTRVANGWMISDKIADPGQNYLLRAEIARGGYINEPEEAMYPASITDNYGEFLRGDRRYQLRFEAGNLPPVDAFWSITAYDSSTSQLTENTLGRYSIGDRTPGLEYEGDGSLVLVLSAKPPSTGISNWLPIPEGPFHVVTRLYLPKPSALSGEYVLPVIERVKP
jgi:hypothetical protein